MKAHKRPSGDQTEAVCPTHTGGVRSGTMASVHRNAVASLWRIPPVVPHKVIARPRLQCWHTARPPRRPQQEQTEQRARNECPPCIWCTAKRIRSPPALPRALKSIDAARPNSTQDHTTASKRCGLSETVAI